MKEPRGWVCPECGEIPEDKIKIYNEKLKEQNFTIFPILPTCLSCGSEIVYDKSRLKKSAQKVIVLTGTCASGKSSTAQILMSRYGFYGIEGDCVKSIIKYKSGNNKIEFNATEMLEEIANEIDILLSPMQMLKIYHLKK